MGCFKKVNFLLILCGIVTITLLWMYNNIRDRRYSILATRTSMVAFNATLPTYTSNAPREDRSHLPICHRSDILVGPLRIDYHEMQAAYYNLTIERSAEIDKLVFEPTFCNPKLAVAIIVPFRDRQQHLEYFLGHLHPTLRRQYSRFQIFVVEQNGNDTFNKGRLMNTGFDFVREIYPYNFDCYIFHDVDMLPENDHNIYGCGMKTNKVHHLSCSVSKFKYKTLCCGMTVGGVLSFTEEQFIKTNGFPNDYWGWGGEDDDMNTRIKSNRMTVKRPSFNLCKYTMVEHPRDELNKYVPSKVNARVDNARKRIRATGLSDLRTIITDAEKKPLYVHIHVDVGFRET